MKTAISIPDEIFMRAQRWADDLGVSRSEFFVRAAQSYLDRLDQHTLTSRINDALHLANADESSDAAVAAGRRTLAQNEEW